MLKNYFKVALRSLGKNKSYVLINTFGLGIAIACCITAYLLLAYNIEFDEAFKGEKIDRTYRIHTHYLNPDGQPGQHINAPVNFGPTVASSFPGIEKYTRYWNDGGYVRYGEKAFGEGVVFADSTFYEMFDFTLHKGDLNSFKDQNTIVLNQKMAKKYFADENPIGKVLTFNFSNQYEVSLKVGAVIQDVPLNSSLTFDIMLRMEHFMDIYNLPSTDWGDWRDPALFIQTKAGVDVASMTELFDDYVALRNEKKKDQNVQYYELHSFNSNFNEEEINWSQINLRLSIVPLIVFTTMAGMILMIACFNLTNTSIAITTKRFKEVGIRKVVGASRANVITQFIFEMIITIILALIAGVIMSRFIVPAFADMWTLPYGLEDLNGLNLIFALLMLVVISALLAGLYPALHNSKYKPVNLLKGNAKQKGTNIFTRGLVAMQFAISVIVLVNGIVFTQNTKYQESIDFGFDKDKVLTINIQSTEEYEVMKTRANRNPKVLNTSITHHQLGWSSYYFPTKVDTTEYQALHIEVGEQFFETMGLKLVQGRFLNTDYTQDLTKSVVVNEAFVKMVELENPINTAVEIRDVKMKIVGVIENHVDNLFRSKEPEPFVFYIAKPNEFHLMLVRAENGDLTEVQDFLEEAWKEEFPTKPFDSQYQEDMMLGDIRGTNANLKKIFIFLTILGGLLSVSGIFALASLNVRKRIKEIGIRKALGASVSNIVKLLSRSFSILLVIAGVFGAVGGYFLCTILLDEIYAYHINIGPITLVLSVLLISGMGILTTGSIVFRAAKENPVMSLRDE
ncbi:MAG: ABC transporter permease [bacterium]|nr:ABC transporter permease [bacterium]